MVVYYYVASSIEMEVRGRSRQQKGQSRSVRAALTHASEIYFYD